MRHLKIEVLLRFIGCIFGVDQMFAAGHLLGRCWLFTVLVVLCLLKVEPHWVFLLRVCSGLGGLFWYLFGGF